MDIIKCINDYTDFLYKNYGGIWKNTIKHKYFSIIGSQVKETAVPFNLEKSDIAVVFFSYTYTAITQNYNSFFSLFYNREKEELDNSINIDGWEMKYDDPVTSSYRTEYRYVTISKDNMRAKIGGYNWKMRDDFPKIWNLFELARTCETQKELDLVVKIFRKEDEITSLKEKNLSEEIRSENLSDQLLAYKDLLDVIKQIVLEK